MSTKTKEEEDFEILRQHILSCTQVSKDSRAVLAALQGIDTELKRMERDAKLKRKFISDNTTPSSTTSTDTTTEKETVTMENEHLSSQTKRSPKEDTNDDETMMEDEWQDIASNGSGSLGNRLAAAAVATMAKHNTEVKTPLGAIALGLHASLVTDSLGFACTGIPENQAPPKGFAPPIRELPKTTLVPPKWEDTTTTPNEIVLRYRKQAVGTVLLRVVQEQHNNMVAASLTRGSNNESDPLVFMLEDHVNLDSFQKALQKSSSVPPALHYKALAGLLTAFCNKFDLGSLREEDSTVLPLERLPYYDSTVIPPQPADPLRIPTRAHRPMMDVNNPYDAPSIQVFQPFPNRGDFAGDLVPPGHGNFMGDRGNLMGPNHPLFAGGRAGGGTMPGGGGFGMRPRFDPYGPPGGPQDPNNLEPPPGGQRRRPPPGGFGNPNNDHARPPSDLGNNMFM